jgi:hypothetical protein
MGLSISGKTPDDLGVSRASRAVRGETGPIHALLIAVGEPT